MIRDEKMQYDINREAAKTSALSSWKLDKYQYLTGEGILLSTERQTTEQPKFAYSPLGKVSLKVEAYCLLIKEKQQNKLGLHTLL